MPDNVFLKTGNQYYISSPKALDMHEKLPVGTYLLQLNPDRGLFVSPVDDFEVSPKIYGDTVSRTERILDTFVDRKNSTGVLLTGEKGSGKTMLAKNICIQAAKKFGFPTIIVNAPFAGNMLNQFMQAIEQPVVVLFDEFEKIYGTDERSNTPGEAQNELLTLLDGVFPSKKLFLLTCNDKWKVNSHMQNRPGRIYYMLEFGGLTADFIREYCADNLNNKEHTDSIVNISATFTAFNFDMLKAMVEEMNRYGETPQECMKMLNTRSEWSANRHITYDVELFLLGSLLPKDKLYSPTFMGNPVAHAFEIEYVCGKDSDGDDEYETAEFTPNQIRKVDRDGRRYILENTKGEKVILTRQEVKFYNGYDLL